MQTGPHSWIPNSTTNYEKKRQNAEEEESREITEMGDRRLHHSAINEVMNLLIKSNRDLSIVQRHLDQEFQATYPDHVNPCKLIARIKKIQEELVSLKDLCRDLLKEKQDLVDKATTLVAQRNSVQRLLASSGLPLINGSDETTYTNLNQVISEWADQFRLRTGDRMENEEDINQMLFSALVHNN